MTSPQTIDTDSKLADAQLAPPPWLAQELRAAVYERWPSDTPENLDWGTLQRAFAVADRFLQVR